MELLKEGTLRSIIKDINSFDENLNIIVYAEKKDKVWDQNSNALVLLEDLEESKSSRKERFLYFLEVYLIKEVIEVWKEWSDNLNPDIEELCDAVIYYAENDAYLPVD
jgi:hypothetical protein